MRDITLSYWEHQSFFGPADVAIIGAGLVGLTAALYLKQWRPGWRVVRLERGPRPSGASTKNAGFACFGSVSELMEQEKRGDLQAVVAARWAGLARLRELLGDAALDYQPVGGYELFRPGEAALAAECREKIAYFNGLLAPVVGHARTFRDASGEAGRFGFAGVGTLLKNEHEGSLDTGRMMRTLLARTWAALVPVLTGCTVKIIEPSGAGQRLLLSNGAAVNAAQVLLATNAFATELLPELAVTPGRGQVLVTEPLPTVTLPGTFHLARWPAAARAAGRAFRFSRWLCGRRRQSPLRMRWPGPPHRSSFRLPRPHRPRAPLPSRRQPPLNERHRWLRCRPWPSGRPKQQLA